MFLIKTIRLSTLSLFFLCGTASYSQTPEDTLRPTNLERDELAPLPVPPPIELFWDDRTATACSEPWRVSANMEQHCKDEEIQASYKVAVEKFGVNKHRFLRCELKSGKSHTGVVQEIRKDRFLLKDGIFAERWISYTQLKSSPRAVQAVGQRVGQGFEWVGLALVTIPLLPFAFLFWDGC